MACRFLYCFSEFAYYGALCPLGCQLFANGASAARYGSHQCSQLYIYGQHYWMPIGWLADSQGLRKPIMILGAIATLLTVAPLFMDIVLSQTQLSMLFFALGLFTSTQVISYPLIAESNPAENIGTATGIASVIIMGF